MKKCEMCHKEFPASFVLNGVVKSLQNRKFCLKCSPYRQHNTKNLRLAKEREVEKDRQCTKCGIVKSIDDFYFHAQKNKRYHCCKQCLSGYMTERHRKLKLQAVEYKGGACVICGYAKCVRALVFHHIDDKEKDFTISHDTSRSWEKIRRELDKCVLICSNCHGEVHAGITLFPHP